MIGANIYHLVTKTSSLEILIFNREARIGSVLVEFLTSGQTGLFCLYNAYNKRLSMELVWGIHCDVRMGSYYTVMENCRLV